MLLIFYRFEPALPTLWRLFGAECTQIFDKLASMADMAKIALAIARVVSEIKAQYLTPMKLQIISISLPLAESYPASEGNLRA